jgi:flagellar basal-body rod protein FlgB
MLNDVINAGAIPTLELSLRFAGLRQQQIAHNVANLSTPNFRQVESSPRAFQQMLARAVADRRSQNGGSSGELNWERAGSRELRRDRSGNLHLVPQTPRGSILAHDRNNRDLEHLMQDHAENATAYRISAELLRGRYQQIREALAERV